MVSLSVLCASVFNGTICYLVGLGIGQRTDAQGQRDGTPQYWFSVRDLLWLTLVVGVALGWIVNRGRFERQRIVDVQTANEASRLRRIVAVYESAQSHWKEGFHFIASHYEREKRSEPPQLTDEQLNELYWQYNAEADAFQTAVPSVPPIEIEWQELLLAFPWLSPNDLADYRQAKRREWKMDHQERTHRIGEPGSSR